MTEDLLHTQTLRQKVFQKIATEWQDKWATPENKQKHGKNFINFEYIKNKNSFYEAFLDDINEVQKQKFGLEEAAQKAISKDSIRRFLDEKYRSNFKEEVKDVFAIYVGYDSWQTFTKQLDKQKGLLTTAEGAEIKMFTIEKNSVEFSDSKNISIKTFSIKKKESQYPYKRYLLLALSLLFTLLIGLFVVNKYWYQIKQNSNYPIFIDIIHKANFAEFRAYKKLPIIDSVHIDSFFTKNGSARKRIMSVLYEEKKKNLILSNLYNPSSYEIQSIKIAGVNKDKEEVYIETVEMWYLRWFDSIKGIYKIGYNETNTQQYILKLENNNWKIHSNVYEGNPFIINFR